MNYLLDTCALSEFVRPAPDAGLVAWLRVTPESRLHISAVSLGEIQQGVSRLPVSTRRQRLQAWLDDDLRQRFSGRVLAFDSAEALLWGSLRTHAARVGNTLPVLDSLIAATALNHQMTLVTRNESDFTAVAGLQVMNPWGTEEGQAAPRP